MDEEFDDSMDISSDVDVSDTDANTDVPEDIPEDIPEDDAISDSDDIAEDIPEDDNVDEDASDDTDFVEELPEDIEDEAAPEDVEDASDMDNIPEDTGEDASVESISDIEDVSEDINGDTSSEDFSEVEDIPEDVEGSEPDAEGIDTEDEAADTDAEDAADVESDAESTDTEDEAADTDAEDTADAESDAESTDTEDEAVETDAEDTADVESDAESTDTEDEAVDTDAEDTADVESDAESTDTEDEAADTDAEDTADVESDVESTDTEDEAADTDAEDTADAESDAESTDTEDEAADTDAEDTVDVESDVESTDTEDEAADTDAEDTADVESDAESTDTEDEAADTDTDVESTDAENEAADTDAEDTVDVESDVESTDTEEEAIDVDVKNSDLVSEASVNADVDKEIHEDESPMNQLAAYMSAHNYGPDDFAEYSQDPEWQKLHSEAFPDYTPPETSDTDTQESAFQQLSDYMNAHNYGPDDFAEYSQDPEWQNLHSKAFPDYTPPETSDTDTQESAFQQLSDYMSAHNYGADDFAEYSQDPEWQRLHSAAFPDATDKPDDLSIETTGIEKTDFNEMTNGQKLEAIENRCKEYGLVRTADFHDFDPDVAVSMTNALEDAKKDFPDLDVNYVGSIDSQVKGIHDTVAQSYENELRRLNGNDFSDEEYQTAAKSYADNYVKRVGLRDSNDAFAWSLKIPSEYDPTGGGLSKYNGVAVNNRFAGDNKLFTECKINEVVTKHKPIGCDTPRATADHELGHEIDKLLDASADKQINDMYNKMISEGNAKDMLSTYSATNIKEFIAEAYSEYRNNPSPRAYSTAVYNRLIELRNMRSMKL